MTSSDVGNRGTAEDENFEGDLGDIYGNPDEDIDFHVVQNPYYGGEVEIADNEHKDGPKDDNEGMVDGKDIQEHSGDIYGEDVDLDFHVVENPYYGGEVEMDQNGDIIPMNDINMSNKEVILSIHNDYYEM